MLVFVIIRVNVNKHQFPTVITHHWRSGQQGLLLPLIKTLTKVFAGYRTFFSPFMQEPAEKLLKYKTKQLNYINVHEATCPEANRFHRFHVLPVLICSRKMKTMYHLYSLLGRTLFQLVSEPDPRTRERARVWLLQYACTVSLQNLIIG